MELLKNVDPKEYEKYARMYGITDFRGLLQAFELLKQSQEEETHRLVNNDFIVDFPCLFHLVKKLF